MQSWKVLEFHSIRSVMKNEADPCILNISQINTLNEEIQMQKPAWFWDSFQRQRSLPVKKKKKILIGWLVSPGHGRLKVYFAFFLAYNFFFPWMKCSIKHWVLQLTLNLVLVPKLFHLTLFGISALCCSQQCGPIYAHWNLLASGCWSARGRSPVALRPCATVSLARFCATRIMNLSAFPRQSSQSWSRSVGILLPPSTKKWMFAEYIHAWLTNILY